MHDLPRLPKSVANKLRRVYPHLRTHPLNGPNIKKLQRWRDLYRYRLGDHRLIYKMDREQRRCVVILLYLGHRKDVYRHLGHDPAREAPTIRVI
ncbi:MAG: type II toxin-antitoxin system RelE/ParE family toxin, partial [Chloroflexota bacterium]|nr:type II toxin-antitoxin system RelE/ParE family toxin [Chloroflexota bacterium]